MTKLSLSPYQQKYLNQIVSFFEPSKKNSFQSWLLEEFVKNPEPFYLPINGSKTQVCRYRVAATALQVGKEYMTSNCTTRLPKGFMPTEVYPAVQKQLGDCRKSHVRPPNRRAAA